MTKQVRQSNFELLRIVFMLLIVVHHYCINSGFEVIIDDYLRSSTSLTFNMFFIQFLSFGGKVGVNGFFIISGYFMITGKMKISKVYRLLSTVLFYNVAVFIFFNLLGYRYDTGTAIKDIIPLLFTFPYSFIASYLLIYLVSDIVNKALNSMTQRDFLFLFAILFFYFTILGTYLAQNTFNYFFWGLAMYIVGAYIRMYPLPSLLNNKKFLILGILVSLLSIWTFILYIDFYGNKINWLYWQYMQTDGNKITVLVMSICIVLLFKNITVKSSIFINTVAASCLGVFLIHTNSLQMIHWLWTNLFKNTEYIGSPYLWLHMLFAVSSIYIVCTIIDYLRIRFIENPIFNKIESRNKKAS